MLGKTTIRQEEREALTKIGRAIAKRGLRLIIPASGGATEAVLSGYHAEGGTDATFLDTKNADQLISQASEVIAFTDLAYQKHLDKRDANWRDRGWLVFHNRKALAEATAMIMTIMEERGTPLSDGGTA